MTGPTTVLLLLALGAVMVIAMRGTATPPELSESESPNRPYVEVGAWSGSTYPADAVVVGYDGKEHSRATMVLAVEEASRRERPLVVLHAVHYPGMVGEPGPGLWHREPGALEAAEEVTARGVAEARALRPDLDVVGATEITGPVRALREALPHANLVVVGTRTGSRALASKILRKGKVHPRRGVLSSLRLTDLAPRDTQANPNDSLFLTLHAQLDEPAAALRDGGRVAEAATHIGAHRLVG